MADKGSHTFELENTPTGRNIMIISRRNALLQGAAIGAGAIAGSATTISALAQEKPRYYEGILLLPPTPPKLTTLRGGQQMASVSPRRATAQSLELATRSPLTLMRISM